MPNSARRTDLCGLETLALGQGGYFDRRDAHSHGITDSLLSYHTRTGRFERVLPGVYRLRVAPISPYDEYLLAWVWTNCRGAISHESALALYDLADILPTRVHVTVPRSFHRTSAPFQVHLAPLPEGEVQTYNGVRVTTPARAIVDAAATGTDPTQIHKAVREALARGLVDPDALRAAAATRSPNQYRRDVRRLLEEALSGATTGTR
ncbi:MAG: type IV toxin-antitoxin system AbiEi family antitoxin domain-containing protein [Chloroflexi bacterium]|nr:type IV toxin-antitoxin system AbiEi family antitoxin domain-containing protein [Chloroflexota bacterium]